MDSLIISSLDEFKRAKSLTRPILLLVKASEITWIYSLSLERIDKIVVIKDTFLFNYKLLPSRITSIVLEPFKIPNQSKLKLDSQLIKEKESIVLRNPRILMKIESVFINFNMLYNLAKVINSLSYFNIKLMGTTEDTASLFNKEIELVDGDEVDLLDKIDLVIGSGSVIRRAIENGKPAIVIGSNGFGGFVSENSIEVLYEFLFTGRPGGYYNELIPGNLLREEILEILNRDLRETLDYNTLFIIKKSQEFEICLKDFILQAKINFEKKESLSKESELMFSPDFSVTTLNESTNIIKYIPLAKNYAIIEKEEALIIDAFQKIISIKTVAKKLGYENDFENFMEFVQGLVNEQILIVQ